MSKIVGYGVSIRNTPIDIDKTVAYQELCTLGVDEIVIDIVRSDTENRPKLLELIDTLDTGDRIDMYSVDALLMGNSQKAVLFYTAILQKGIDLLIFDFSGGIAKLSPYSSLRFGNSKAGEQFFVKSLKSPAELIDDFSVYISNAIPEKNSGGLRTAERLNISDAFKEIYFAYESYQIDQKTALTLLKEYCGISNKITFWLMARDYETTLHYSDDLSNQSFEIFDLPKRCGGLPEEYYQITRYAENLMGSISSEKERVEMAMDSLNMISSYNVYHRWQLVADKVPKPRKPVPINFSIKEFQKKYKKI